MSFCVSIHTTFSAFFCFHLLFKYMLIAIGLLSVVDGKQVDSLRRVRTLFSNTFSKRCLVGKYICYMCSARYPADSELKKAN